MFKSPAFKQAARISGVLTVICVCVALIVSAVYALTVDAYNRNLAEQQRKAIASLFSSETVTVRQMVLAPNNTGSVYCVYEGETVVGYCARVSSSGFGGDIDLMVGVDNNTALLGVKILAMSETPGLGARTGEESYLAGYIGKDGSQSLIGKQDVDFISGATISSKAVLSGVNNALQLIRDCRERGEFVE